MSDPIKITEFGQLYADKSLNGKKIRGKLIEQATFDSLEEFIGRLNTENSGEDEAFKDVLRLSSSHGRPTLQAQNYVGVISAGEQTIEILPKITKDYTGDSICESQEAFMYMLSFLRDAPFRQLRKTALSSGQFPIMEMFICAFLNEVEDVVKKGLKSKYNMVSGNERFLKGRLDFSEQIRKNIADQSCFAIKYSKFTLDAPENNIIKSALLLVGKIARNGTNRGRIRRLLDRFSDVAKSRDPFLDYRACIKDRNSVHYRTALLWSMLFLEGKSPQPFSGMFGTEAILFPMESVFESYVAKRLKAVCAKDGTIIKPQDSRYSLVDTPSRQYSLRPDIVAQRKGVRVVLDTKWKMNVEPSQSDMYQMFAYSMKYKVDNVILVYPSYSKDSNSEIGKEYGIEIDGRRVSIHTFYFKLPSKNENTSNPPYEDGVKCLRNFLNQYLPS